MPGPRRGRPTRGPSPTSTVPRRARGRRTCSWSTSRPGWWCTRARVSAPAPSCTGCSRATPSSRASATTPSRPGHRPPPRQGHLRAPARRAHAARPTTPSSAPLVGPRRAPAVPRAGVGHVDAPRGLIDAPIGRSAREPTRMAVDERGKEARTRYEVRRRFAEPVEVTELACTLETGRTHQIRVHLRSIGHPVVGDARYGGARQSLPMARPVPARRARWSSPTRSPDEPLSFRVAAARRPRGGARPPARGARELGDGLGPVGLAAGHGRDVGQREAVEVAGGCGC